MVWPRNRSEKLTLRCTIDPKQPQAYVKMKDWTQRSPQLLQQQLKGIKPAREEILQEIWTQVCHNTTPLLSRTVLWLGLQ